MTPSRSSSSSARVHDRMIFIYENRSASGGFCRSYHIMIGFGYQCRLCCASIASGRTSHPRAQATADLNASKVRADRWKLESMRRICFGGCSLVLYSSCWLHRAAALRVAPRRRIKSRPFLARSPPDQSGSHAFCWKNSNTRVISGKADRNQSSIVQPTQPTAAVAEEFLRTCCYRTGAREPPPPPPISWHGRAAATAVAAAAACPSPSTHARREEGRKEERQPTALLLPSCEIWLHLEGRILI